MKICPVAKILTLALTLAALPALADDDSFSDMFKFSGFGTIGFARNSTDEAQFVAGPTPSGAGKTADWGIDTLLAGQVDAKFGHGFAGVVQALSQRDAYDSYKPKFEWAFLSYSPVSDLKIRAGRMAIPIFMLSDARLVGYADPEIRPPVDLYTGVRFTHEDGVDLSYSPEVGDGTLTIQPYLGKTSRYFPSSPGTPYLISWNRIRGLAVSYDQDAFSARVGAAKGNVKIGNDPIQALWDGFRNPSIDAVVPSALTSANYY